MTSGDGAVPERLKRGSYLAEGTVFIVSRDTESSGMRRLGLPDVDAVVAV